MPSYYQSVQSLFLQAPPGKVYGALTDWSLRAQWRKGIQVKWEGPPQAFVGQEVAFRVPGPLLRYTVRFRVTGLEPPHRFYLEYFGKPLEGRHGVEVAAREGGCLVSFYWMKVKPVGLAAKLYFGLGLGSRAHRRRVTETLRMLKEFAENQAPS